MKLTRTAKYHTSWNERVERNDQLAYDKLVLKLPTVELIEKYKISSTRIRQISDKYELVDDRGERIEEIVGKYEVRE